MRMPRGLHAAAKGRIDEAARRHEPAERPRPGGCVEVAGHEARQRRGGGGFGHAVELRHQLVGAAGVEWRKGMRGNEPEVASRSPHGRHDAREASVGKRHHLDVVQRPAGEQGNPEVVGSRADHAVWEHVSKAIERGGPVRVDLEHCHHVGSPIAEIRHGGGRIVVYAMHIHGHDEHAPLIRGGGRGHRRRLREPVGEQVAGVHHGGDCEVGHGRRPPPAQARGQASEREHEPIPAKVGGEVEEPVP